MSDDAQDLSKRQLYTLTFENDPRPILVFGQGARVLLVNRAASELLRRVGDEVIAHFASEASADGGVAIFAQFSRELRLRGRGRLDLPLPSGPLTLEGRSHGDQIIVHLVAGGGRKRAREHLAETVRPSAPARLSSLPTTRPKAMLRTA